MARRRKKKIGFVGRLGKEQFRKFTKGGKEIEKFKRITKQRKIQAETRQRMLSRLKETREIRREQAQIRAMKRELRAEKLRPFKTAFQRGKQTYRVIGGKRRRVKTTPSGRKIRITITEPVDQRELEARRRRERTGIGPNYDLPTFELGDRLKQFDTGKGKFGVGRKKKRKRRKQRSKMRRFTF
jgi:hypothetical protein